MTPQFTTACYVRVEDKDKRKEVCEKLEEMGYKSTLSVEPDSWGNLIVVRRYGVIQNTWEYLRKLPTHLIDCSDNIDLFLALASMRSDTDMGQWFIDEDENIFTNNTEKYNGPREVKRLTAQEIIEHFKTKEK